VLLEAARARMLRERNSAASGGIEKPDVGFSFRRGFEEEDFALPPLRAGMP